MQPWRKTILCSFLALVCLIAGSFEGSAQQSCVPPPLPSHPSEANIFTGQQEVFLGDVIAEQISKSLRTTNDPEMTAYLQRIADRLIKRLPDSRLDTRFNLVDLATPNSFVIPGGRIYVSPKLISLAQSEDELAAVIAHEIGHLVTHQTAIRVTRELNEFGGVTSVGDRQDIFRKYNLLIDNARRKPRGLRNSRQQSDQQQLEADSVALFLIVSAGYSPGAIETILERTSGASEKGGGWLSSLFGRTAPDVRRLREMIRGLESLPPNGVDHVASSSSEGFHEWKRKVHEYSGWDHQQALHDVLSEIYLNPPLQPALTKLRFSPDGNYVLAQDAASIYVLTAQPLTAIMQVEAPGGVHAQFTPDSQCIVFDNGRMRVEKWEIATRKRVSVYELANAETCAAAVLSPDGTVLACFVKPNRIILLDVPTGEKIYEIKELIEARVPAFITMPYSYQTISTGLQHSGFLHMSFSPDGRYFVAASGNNSVAIEVTSHHSVTLAGSIRKNLSGGFAFLDRDRILAVPEFKENHSLLLKFPTGEKLGELQLGRGEVTASPDGNFVMLRPIKDFAVGVWDTGTKQAILSNKEPALDLFGNHFVREQNDGEVGYFEISGDGEKKVLVNRINLPSGRLGGIGTLSVSEDLSWLALSGGQRGAVWDLRSGARLYMVRGFRGAFFDQPGEVYVDFPKFDQMERILAKASLQKHDLVPARKITDDFASLWGKYLMSLRSAKGGNFEVVGLGGQVILRETDVVHGWTLTVSDPLTGVPLWSRQFSNEGPALLGASHFGNIVLMWKSGAKQFKEEEDRFPEIRTRLSASAPDKDDELLEVVDLQSGRLTGSLLLDTGKGSYSVVRAMVAGDWVAVGDSANRTQVYSLARGVEIGKCFGEAIAMNLTDSLLAVQNGRGHLDLYNLDSMDRVDSYVFPTEIIHAQFSPAGNRLLVLTSQQIAYTLALDAPLISERR